MSANLSSLPSELLSGIIANISEQGQLRTLYSLALCCRRLNSIVLPYLYNSVSLDCHLVPHIPSSGPLRAFTKLMLEKPEIGALVKELQLDCSPRQEEEIFDPVEEVFKVAIKASSQSESEEQRWLSAIRKDDADPLIALLLPALPNLQSLGVGVIKELNFYWSMIRRAGLENDSCLLSSLSKVVHSGDGDRFLHQMALYLHLPAIKRLFFSAGYEHDDNKLEDFNLDLSTLAQLELWNCHIKIDQLRKILRPCQVLKKFLYANNTLYHFHGSESPRFEEVADILEANINTLESLCIDIQDDHRPGFTMMSAPLTLKRFKVLWHVQFPLELIFNYCKTNPEVFDQAPREGMRRELRASIDRLPAALQWLCITSRYPSSVVRVYEFLLENMDQKIPNLKELILELPSRDKKSSYHLTKLESLAKTKGVRVRIVLNLRIN
ncbi:MAG: hypothetical protein M1834_007079 [Cirrosporium novae-zelandiae]|nr:MAG: hypothetical protein M1834_007079 [Cirrosporium novae-zelandiae]